MVEEEAGVEIVAEVDQKAVAALFDLDEAVAVVELAVLVGALLSLPFLDKDPLRRAVQGRGQGGGDFIDPETGLQGIDTGRRVVFLDVAQPW